MSAPPLLPPPANLRALGHAIAIARREQGLTLEGLAERAGTSRQTIINIEMGHKAARIDTLHAIAYGLGTPLAQLVENIAAPN